MIEHPTADRKALAARAKAGGIIVAVRGGRLRISPHVYNTLDEIDRLAEVLRT